RGPRRIRGRTAGHVPTVVAERPRPGRLPARCARRQIAAAAAGSSLDRRPTRRRRRRRRTRSPARARASAMRCADQSRDHARVTTRAEPQTEAGAVSVTRATPMEFAHIFFVPDRGVGIVAAIAIAATVAGAAAPQSTVQMKTVTYAVRDGK